MDMLDALYARLGAPVHPEATYWGLPVEEERGLRGLVRVEDLRAPGLPGNDGDRDLLEALGELYVQRGYAVKKSEHRLGNLELQLVTGTIVHFVNGTVQREVGGEARDLRVTRQAFRF